MPTADPVMEPFSEQMTPAGLRRGLRAALVDVVREQAGTLDARICEYTVIPTGATTTAAFMAQTSNTEIIEGLLICALGGANLPPALGIQIGEYQFAALGGTSGFVAFHNLAVVTKDETRAVTLTTTAGAPFAALGPVSVLLWGCAAPGSLAPGILH